MISLLDCNIRYKFGIIALFFMLITTASAGEIDTLRKGAESGSAEDQAELGLVYLRGGDVAKDLTQAAIWLKKASQQGNARAQVALGYMHGEGLALTQDYKKAFYWYQEAAKQDFAKGQCSLGVSYELGRGVDKNPQKAAFWYRKAADQGVSRAQVNLAILFETGLGVEQDYGEAVKLYKKAADNGYLRGITNLGLMYEKGLGVDQNLSRAINLYESAAAQGYSRASGYLKRLRETPDPILQEDVTKKEGKDSDALEFVQVDKSSYPSNKLQAIEHFLSGNRYAHENNLLPAISEYEKAIALDPSNSNTYQNLAVVYSQKGDLLKALELMRTVVQLSPNNSFKHVALGAIYELLQDKSMAMVQYLNAININPGLGLAYDKMAEIYLFQGRLGLSWKCAKMAESLGVADQSLLRRLENDFFAEKPMVLGIEKGVIHLRQLVFSLESNAEKVVAGQEYDNDFCEISSNNSLLPHNLNCGYWGIYKESELLPSVVEILTDLPVFQFSPVIETNQGFHVFQKISVPSELLSPSIN